MKRIIKIAALIALLYMPTHANADVNKAGGIVMFPPNQSSCQTGQPNLLIWDGANTVACMPVPTCGSTTQILHFDGHSLTCS